MIMSTRRFLGLSLVGALALDECATRCCARAPPVAGLMGPGKDPHISPHYDMCNTTGRGLNIPSKFERKPFSVCGVCVFKCKWRHALWLMRHFFGRTLTRSVSLVRPLCSVMTSRARHILGRQLTLFPVGGRKFLHYGCECPLWPRARSRAALAAAPHHEPPAKRGD